MKNILVVDDNKVVLDAITIFFSCELPEYAVWKAYDGMEAIETLETITMDLILTDLNMPVVNGYQLIEYVKRNLPSIPVFGMTCVRTHETVDRLRRLGVSSCIEKPFDLNEVAHTISAALEPAAQTSAA